jgi:hypothetical protein
MPRQSTRSKPPVGKQKCTACENEKKLGDFYASSSTLFSSGRVPICKSCIKEKSLDTSGEVNLDKFHNILRQIDKPFLLSIYQSACDEAQISLNTGVGRTDVLGTYFKNIQSLPQNKNLTYADSEDYNKKFPVNQYASAKASNGSTSKSNADIYNNGDIEGKVDEKLVYSKKWIGNYTATDLEYLENYYDGLDRDYKIATENHKDYARKIAKASLQMDKCFEDMMAGVSGADTRYKNARETFDSLCKSAKFSESTRSLNDVGLSSFSIITDRVEAHNWIPEHTPVIKDDIDKLLDYLSTITKSL